MRPVTIRASLLILASLAAGCLPNKHVELKTQATPEQQMACQLDGAVFGDLAIQRDAGRSIEDAVAAVRGKYQGLGADAVDQRTIASLMARAENSAGAVYTLRVLKPNTIKFYGAYVCMMQAFGQADPLAPVALAQGAQSCQYSYPPGAADEQLEVCIRNEALRLVTRTRG